MPDVPTSSDEVELTRRFFAAGDRDALMAFYAADAVWDMSTLGLGVYEGREAIRRFFEDWTSSYEAFELEPEEIVGLGSGVVIAVIRQNARPVGSSAHVELRYASVSVWVAGLNVRTTNYRDIDEGRAAAARLAESRGG
jgi:ketosteroid isomerase-like protein